MRAALVALTVLLGSCGSGPQGAKRDVADGLLGILVTPDDLLVPVGQAVQLEATGLYGGRRSEDLTHVVTWRSDDRDIATVSNALDTEGLLSGVDVGTVEVWARLDGTQSVPVLVTVTDLEVEALLVEPSSVVLEVDQRVELAATARFSDGTLTDATAQVRWVTGDADVATLDGAVLTAEGDGETEVVAVWGEVESEPVPVEVLAQANPNLTFGTVVPYPGDGSLTVEVEVENTGEVGASDFWVDVFVDPDFTPGPGDVGDDYARVTYVGPDDAKTVDLTISGLAVGGHDVVVVLDIEDEVDESDESDNVEEVAVDLDEEALEANLVVAYWGWLADPYYAYYYVEVGNYGDVSTDPFWVDVYVDQAAAPVVGEDGDDYVQVPGLAPWEVTTVEFLVYASCTGCESWIQVDSTDAVPERIEADNVVGPELVSW